MEDNQAHFAFLQKSSPKSSNAPKRPIWTSSFAEIKVNLSHSKETCMLKETFGLNQPSIKKEKSGAMEKIINVRILENVR